MNDSPKYTYIPPIRWKVLTPLYDFFCALGGLGEGFKKKVLDAVLLAEEATVVDIGCGTGVFLKVAKLKYPKATFVGIDPDEQALAIARQRLACAGLTVELKRGFAEALPLADASVDVCFSTLAFHHMPNEVKHRAVQEIYRVLRPGGVVVLADFGVSKNWVFRRLFFFENLEYLRGNFDGLLPRYLKQAGFSQARVVDAHFPRIDILTALKPERGR